MEYTLRNPVKSNFTHCSFNSTFTLHSGTTVMNSLWQKFKTSQMGRDQIHPKVFFDFLK